MRDAALLLGVSLFAVFAGTGPGQAATPVRFGEVVRVEGGDLAMLHGSPLDRLTLMACLQASCRPIPFQIDARDAAGDWVLDQGPAPNAAAAAGVFARNDLLLFMAGDAGDRTRRADLPGWAAVEIGARDPASDTTRWAYLVAFQATAPRSAVSYVHYDPNHDRARGQQISLGFTDGIPDYLAVAGNGATEPDGTNLLDRLKIRATATLLWGLIRFSRDESDLRTEFVAWRQGPVRVIRRQRQRVRLGWGIRSPTFVSYAYFYRDFAEMPVSLRLNFPPTYFFSAIIVRAILDFRDLKSWSLITPSLPHEIPIEGAMSPAKIAVNNSADAWFALKGARVTLVQTMGASPSLATVRRRLLYRQGSKPFPPETVPGEEPGIGFVWDQWSKAGAGLHQLVSISYALPPGVDVHAFMAARNSALQVTVHPPNE